MAWVVNDGIRYRFLFAYKEKGFDLPSIYRCTPCVNLQCRFNEKLRRHTDRRSRVLCVYVWRFPFDLIWIHCNWPQMKFRLMSTEVLWCICFGISHLLVIKRCVRAACVKFEICHIAWRNAIGRIWISFSSSSFFPISRAQKHMCVVWVVCRVSCAWIRIKIIFWFNHAVGLMFIAWFS